MRVVEERRDCGGQIRGSRPAGLFRAIESADDGIVGRPLCVIGGVMQRVLGLSEIRIAGFGGQGVILAAAVIGKAAAIFQGAHATMTQSFGPEARGGSSSAQVILSGEPILYPYITRK